MKAELEKFIEEISMISDAEELRRHLIAEKEENISLRNRESEILRQAEAASQLYLQIKETADTLREENRKLEKKLAKAEARNLLDANARFGRKTEKTADLMASAKESGKTGDPLSEDAPETQPSAESGDDTGKQPAPKHGKRKKGKREKDLAGLPRRTFYEYDEAELDQLFGKGNWRVTGWHKTEKIEYIPALYYVKTTCTPVLSVGLEHTMACLVPKDRILLPGSDATPALVAALMNNKFSLSLPAYRQARELASMGINLSRQTMTNWIIRFSTEMFERVYVHLAKLLVASGCTQCDETTLLVIRDGRRAGRKSYMWVHVTSELADGHPITVYTYEPDRSADHLRSFYDDYEGEIICDAYSAYQSYEAENGDRVIICGCMMHCRRRFAEALRIRNAAGMTDDEIGDLPEAKALRLIADIYKEDNLLKDKSEKERLAGRKTLVKEKVDAFYDFLTGFDLEDPSVSDKLKDAVNYAQNQKEHLTRFLRSGKVPIDNGKCERKCRSFGIGRNNWMFCTSKKGAKSSAIMYTLAETAKDNGASVYYYLKYLLERAPLSPELEIGEKALDDLMPWSEAYKAYEAEQKELVHRNCLPPSDKEPTGRKLMQGNKHVA